MILILTQSTTKGANYRIAKDCSTIIEKICGIDPEIRNFNDLPPHKLIRDIKEIDKIVMVVPEWNGSFPYTLKKMIDEGFDPATGGPFKNKEVYLVGTSGGLGGNMQGLSHLSDILAYVGAKVHPQRIYFPMLKNFNKKDPQAIASSQMLAELMEEVCSIYANT